MTPDMLGRRILIVDDDERISLMLDETLKREGFVCTTASNAGIAADKLRYGEFELVFLDINPHFPYG